MLSMLSSNTSAIVIFVLALIWMFSLVLKGHKSLKAGHHVDMKSEKMNKLAMILMFILFPLLSNQQYSYAEPIGLDSKICTEDCMLVKPPLEHPQ